jgi:non-ribosomal peptide synthetase component F
LFLERSPEGIIAMLATLKAGLTYVPIDAKYPQDRIAMIIEDAKLSIIITSETLSTQLEEIQGIEIHCLDQLTLCLRVIRMSRPIGDLRFFLSNPSSHILFVLFIFLTKNFEKCFLFRNDL